MPSSTEKSAYTRGLAAGTPFLLVIAPFAAVFGVVASEAGLTLTQTMGFSVLVIAGASQITAVQLMVDQAPVFIVLAAALAVNLRMAMYSAALAPHLGPAPLWQRAVVAYFNVDQCYALSTMEYESSPAMGVGEKVAFFMGVATPVGPPWYLATWAGAALGARIPESWPIDFAVPIAFLAMVAPMLKTTAHFAAAATSVVLALALAGLPYNLGLLAAAAGAMAVGAEIDRRSQP